MAELKKDEWYVENDEVVRRRTFDVSREIKQMEIARDLGIGHMGEDRFVGRIPSFMLTDWCREAGIAMTDKEGVAEIIKRKMLSGDFDKFRSDWKGSWNG